MNHVLLLPILIPLFSAGVIVALPLRAKRLQRALNALAIIALLPVACLLMARAAQGEIASYALGAWPAPFGIVLELDRLGALMLVLTAVLAVCCLLGTSSEDARRGRYFRALFQFELMGLNGAFLAGDLFNLFVFFELLLIASYALLLHGGGARRVRNGLHYLLMNLVGSSFFLVAIGVLYGVTGTLNMADMGERLARLGPESLPLAQFAGATLMLVFGLKAAVFPMSFWLPQAYRSAIGPVAALFAIMTKVGIYAMLRCDALVFGAAGGVLDAFMHQWAWWLAIATIVFGALGALAVSSLKTTTGYLVLVSVGLLIAAIALQTPLAWSALLYYLISTTLCTGALFLLADTLEPEQAPTPHAAHAAHAAVSADINSIEPGSLEALDDAAAAAISPDPDREAVATLARVQPLQVETAGALAVPVGEPARTEAEATVEAVPRTHAPWPSNVAALLYLIAAVGAAGLPPLSGFLGKAMVLTATPLDAAVVLWPAVLLSSLLSIVALSRTGTRLMWAAPAARAAAGKEERAPRGSNAKLAACAVLLGCVVAITLGAGAVRHYLTDTATQLFDRAAYVHAILPAARSSPPAAAATTADAQGN
ncbi:MULTISPECIES: monovalent cation/H+ antiporter subunit D [unclassified Paraburkholderia]|uniref:monovalent cation/H+ antiporter subunit D n=1 Tax=unclassified Paraburkholderia TaxID=2615204 RepID=UPI00161A90A3|nr:MULTISPECIES: monovalent cation/H+ antiporter subunit D [unclassified Paraburkholderia]MBB5446332.1 multicomponent K+:H+ antiporter subunit D [Paraburkholderia sp. WSM4177]MBB5486879.1 multicomponent K+:H+ antiporter subunit D [Paraburkholderia sp. WSM4180]